MRLGKHWWLLVPLAIGCAGAQKQQATQAGGKSTLTDEGPASASNTAAPAGAAGATGTTAATGAAGQPASSLVRFQSKGGFTVLMPPNPEQSDRTQEAPGGNVQVHIAQAQDPSGKYLSTYSEFPPGSLNRIKTKDLLDSLQQATVQSMGGTLVNSRDLEVGGLPGREFTATDPQGSEVTARLFVASSRVYTLAGTYPQGQIPGSIQQFLASFSPPPGGVGGSGPADGVGDVSGSGAAPGTSDSLSATSSDASTAAPAKPTKSSKKRSRRSSSSTTTQSTTDTSSSSR
jgi:hypothetical protein